MINQNTSISATYQAGSTITSQKIKYNIIDENGIKSVADLSTWIVKYNLYDKDKNIVHTADIIDGVLIIPSDVTILLKGYYLCNIILVKGTFIDKEFFVGITISAI